MAFSYALRMGKGGWVWWQLADRDLTGFVRFGEVGDRLVIQELYMPNAPKVRDLARVPLAALEARANNSNDQVGKAIRMMLGEPAVDLATAISYFATPARVAPGWVGDMLKSQDPAFDIQRVQRKKIEPVIPDDPQEVDARLDVPRSKPFPDEFYRQLADVYMNLSARYPNPNARIADANEVSVERVEQWVIRARQLGHLLPAQHGRRG